MKLLDTKMEFLNARKKELWDKPKDLDIRVFNLSQFVCNKADCDRRYVIPSKVSKLKNKITFVKFMCLGWKEIDIRQVLSQCEMFPNLKYLFTNLNKSELQGKFHFQAPIEKFLKVQHFNIVIIN